MEGEDKMHHKPKHVPLSPEKVTRDGVASPLAHRQTLLNRTEPGKLRARFAECAGSTATDCAVVFCCCPCGMAHLLFVAVVKLPARLLRQALRRRKGKLRKGRRIIGARKAGMSAVDDEDVYEDLSVYRGSLLSTVSSEEVLWRAKTSITADDLAELEKEMSTSFYAAGFWRSLSQIQSD